MFREIRNANYPLHYNCYHTVKCHTVNGSAAYITHINFHALPKTKNYMLWNGFCTILHFQEILVLILNL